MFSNIAYRWISGCALKILKIGTETRQIEYYFCAISASNLTYKYFYQSILVSPAEPNCDGNGVLLCYLSLSISKQA